MSIQNDIQELLDAKVIDESVADKIQRYYSTKTNPASNVFLLIFGVLGALLIGLGIILILAHNWDQLPRFIKTIFAFTPLLIGQSICAYTLIRKEESTSWREASSVFLILAIGACIALVSQIYHINGELRSFISIWMLLALPVMYIMRSFMASLLLWFATTVFIILSFPNRYQLDGIWKYLLFLIALCPFYFNLLKNKVGKNATAFHNWFIPINLLYGLGLLMSFEFSYAPIAFICLLGIFYMLGHLQSMKKYKLLGNGYLIIGALGSVGLLLAASFGEFWTEIDMFNFKTSGNAILSLISTTLLFIGAISFLYYHHRKGSLDTITPVMPVFLIFFFIFIIGIFQPSLSQILVNILLLAVAVYTIKSGVEQDHLGILNYGLLIISALLICRFFDVNISFVLRGVLFIVVGIAFFVANNRLLQKRKNHGQ